MRTCTTVKEKNKTAIESLDVTRDGNINVVRQAKYLFVVLAFFKHIFTLVVLYGSSLNFC